MTKMLRDHLDLARREGLTIVGIKPGRHCRLHVRTPDGREALLTVAATPSDRRAILNFRADARRLVRTA